jgi:hypothetical protein
VPLPAGTFQRIFGQNSGNRIKSFIMIQQYNKALRSGLKTIVFTGIVVLAVISLGSFTSRRLYADLWQQLGIGKDQGTNKIKASFLEGYLSYYGARNIKNVALSDRSALAKDLLIYTKQYVQGESFQKEYGSYRQSKKPHEPASPKTADRIRQEFIESTKQGIENLEKGLKTADEGMKKTLQETLNMFKQQLKDYQDPNNEMIRMAVQGNQTQYEWSMNTYKEDLKKWEAAFPENPTQFIKQRLQYMLEETANVDYAAALTERNGLKYFVKPEYERKSTNWKMAFRAGAAVTETVRAFAKQWMSEL